VGSYQTNASGKESWKTSSEAEFGAQEDIEAKIRENPTKSGNPFRCFYDTLVTAPL